MELDTLTSTYSLSVAIGSSLQSLESQASSSPSTATRSSFGSIPRTTSGLLSGLGTSMPRIKREATGDDRSGIEASDTRRFRRILPERMLPVYPNRFIEGDQPFLGKLKLPGELSPSISLASIQSIPDGGEAHNVSCNATMDPCGLGLNTLDDMEWNVETSVQAEASESGRNSVSPQDNMEVPPAPRIEQMPFETFFDSQPEPASYSISSPHVSFDQQEQDEYPAFEAVEAEDAAQLSTNLSINDEGFTEWQCTADLQRDAPQESHFSPSMMDRAQYLKDITASGCNLSMTEELRTLTNDQCRTIINEWLDVYGPQGLWYLYYDVLKSCERGEHDITTELARRERDEVASHVEEDKLPSEDPTINLSSEERVCPTKDNDTQVRRTLKSLFGRREQSNSSDAIGFTKAKKTKKSSKFAKRLLTFFGVH
ncbi:hypothetical protein FRC03_011335 [Tulasnella sp. 419]|nr:hypothetical protein FRC03_011335 [Tulasnella sp. 419]